MKIRTKISLLFIFLSVIILFAFASLIYLSAKRDREVQFFTRLKKEAVTKANLFFDAQVSAKTLQRIYKNNRQTISEVEVAIYDSTFNLVYHDASELDFVKETKEMMHTVFSNGQVRLQKNNWDIIGIKYKYEGKKYLVTAAAYDQFGYNKLQTLFESTIAFFVLSIIMIYIIAYFFALHVLDPIREMTDKAKQISGTNLDLRLVTTPDKDELTELAETFNQMLNRLENSFDAQKSFVSNISHELRTPLAAIVAELELTSEKERTNTEYKLAIHNALNDARKMVRLSNSLLDFAKASYDPSEISFRLVRIDELILDACLLIQKSNPDYKIDIHFEEDFEDDAQISVNANEYLLKTAFVNLMENGCKFSPEKQMLVSIFFDKNGILVSFEDHGIGISEKDLERLFTPFFRGENKSHADGNGIGLSLTKRIVELHGGTIQVKSIKTQGTTFLVHLPYTY